MNTIPANPQPNDTLLLTRDEVNSLISIGECIEAVEHVFKLYGEGKISPPGILGFHAPDGGFHIKAGLSTREKSYFVAKINANFPQNLKRFGLPSIQGVIVLSDGENGRTLAVMDSIAITIQRTGAATAVAAKYLSRSDAKVATICGAGNQGRTQLRSLMQVRTLQQAFVYDLDVNRSSRMCEEFSRELACQPVTKEDLSMAIGTSDICVTCTPSRKHFVNRNDVRPGTFVAGVGADSEEKQELDPRLFVGTTVVVDMLDQCATIGDLHHALSEGLLKKVDVHAELAEVVVGRKTGRTSDEEITIFDSTGVAHEDAAAALLVYEKARKEGVGTVVQFNR